MNGPARLFLRLSLPVALAFGSAGWAQAAVPAQEVSPVAAADGLDLDDLATRMRRLQLAALAMDATQARVQSRLRDLDVARDATHARLATATGKVREVRADTARSVSLHLAADQGRLDSRQRALRRIVWGVQQRNWATVERRRQGLEAELAGVRAQLSRTQLLMSTLDREAAEMAIRRDQVDDAPIAVVGLEKRSRQMLADRAAAEAEPRGELVWPATAQAALAAAADVTDGVPQTASLAARGWDTARPLGGTPFVQDGNPYLSRRGIAFDVAPGEPVGAPAAGTIVFAGPFRTYGLILIIEHDDGYHTLMAGFSHLHVGLGASVRPGDAMGDMARASDSSGRLYVEVRHQGVPVDPMPWLAARENRVRG